MKLSPFEQELNRDIWTGRTSTEEARAALEREQGGQMAEIPTGFDAGLGERQQGLPTLDEVLADLNGAIASGRITTQEAEEALRDYGQTQE